MKDLYAVLGVLQNATPEEITKAYKRLAAKYHPDRTGGDKEAEAKFKEAKEAYETLSDPEKRQQYDESGKVSILENPIQTAQELWGTFIHQTMKGLL